MSSVSWMWSAYFHIFDELYDFVEVYNEFLVPLKSSTYPEGVVPPAMFGLASILPDNHIFSDCYLWHRPI